jgi:hypothetical protein
MRGPARLDFKMTAPVALVVDLLRWVATSPRTYRDTIDAWRTSCPRLPVWEDALESGFLEVAREDGQEDLTVSVTPVGRAFLQGGHG